VFPVMFHNTSMTQPFNCTACGKCCHNLKIALSVQESIDWIERSNQIQIICEAIPWLNEPNPLDEVARYKKNISVAAISGSLPIRILIYFVGFFEDACPNLQKNNQCGVYSDRPLTCRIYPAEINPFIEMNPLQKACPDEAWIASDDLLTPVMQSDILQYRQSAIEEIESKAHVCDDLKIDVASIANQAYVIHTPDQKKLMQSLKNCKTKRDADIHNSWKIKTHVLESQQTLQAMGAVCQSFDVDVDSDVQYVRF